MTRAYTSKMPNDAPRLIAAINILRVRYIEERAQAAASTRPIGRHGAKAGHDIVASCAKGHCSASPRTLNALRGTP